MKDEDLSRQVSILVPIGHVLMAWQTLTEKFSDLRSNEALSEAERRAIWGLADLLEQTLAAHGIGSRPQPDWEALIERAAAFMQLVPVDGLDE